MKIKLLIQIFSVLCALPLLVAQKEDSLIKFLPEDTGLEWFVFSDIGSLWGTDYESGVRGYDDKEPRVTNGFGLSMITPVGPLQMLWGFPVQSETYDNEENFQFSIGTSF